MGREHRASWSLQGPRSEPSRAQWAAEPHPNRGSVQPVSQKLLSSGRRPQQGPSDVLPCSEHPPQFRKVPALCTLVMCLHHGSLLRAGGHPPCGQLVLLTVGCPGRRLVMWEVGCSPRPPGRLFQCRAEKLPPTLPVLVLGPHVAVLRAGPGSAACMAGALVAGVLLGPGLVPPPGTSAQSFVLGLRACPQCSRVTSGACTWTVQSPPCRLLPWTRRWGWVVGATPAHTHLPRMLPSGAGYPHWHGGHGTHGARMWLPAPTAGATWGPGPGCSCPGMTPGDGGWGSRGPPRQGGCLGSSLHVGTQQQQ